MVAGDTAGTFVVAKAMSAGASPTDFVMVPGHAALVLSTGAVATEPVSCESAG
jgi:hypothetical protein